MLVSESITRLRYQLQDLRTTKNYSNEELYGYYNIGMMYISHELARIAARFDISTDTLSYAEHAYSADLESDFLSLSYNEKGEPRVFNVTNDYARMTEASFDEMDDWESETNADDGTPNRFLINNGTMIINPRADAAMQVKYYYHALQSITDGNDDMPWDDKFNFPLEAFVARYCHLRSEMGPAMQTEQADFSMLKSAITNLSFRRHRLQLVPAASFGWAK